MTALGPRRPLAVSATSVALLGVAFAGAAAHAYTFAAYLVAAALLPARPRAPETPWGAGLAYGSFGWELLGLAPLLAGLRLEGPWGGPPWLFAVAVLASLARVAALGSEAAARWNALWRIPEPSAAPVQAALEAALRAPPEARDTRVDEALAALAGASSSDVPGDAVRRRAFWINAYNVMASHAARGRRGTSALGAIEALRTVYGVAGRRLSVETIEHGLLRGNARPPGLPWRLLGAGDDLLDWAVPLDPRVHFALNCAARSCPPIRVYRGEALDAQLDLAEQAFLEGATVVDADSGQVRTSRILQWYERDLGGRAAVLARIETALGREPGTLASMGLAYEPYDWSPPH